MIEESNEKGGHVFGLSLSFLLFRANVAERSNQTEMKRKPAFRQEEKGCLGHKAWVEVVAFQIYAQA